ncbi:pyocin S6 family toxin immunity protein [Pseudomonas chlororaphis]|uniref:Uncharacterized protein n=1 Tax=Pseudomonas chlororaphis TaxID=587753 RepID=A0A1Q8ERW3_9PSED|nr:pyocin S6 family toxin immunity protein [Pseudomonas chlororaphis]OLF54528.1 hypothetical protein BTN82_11015 [Pseudomonas chlororaphis]
MYLCITGFLPDGFDDTSLKFELDVASECERAVMDILGWESLAAESDGELPLTSEQVWRISEVIKTSLPDNLDLFIGVEA